MITPEQIYWITRADAFLGTSIAMAILCMFAFTITAALYDRRYNDHVWPIVTSLVLAVVFTVAAIFTPSTKDIAAMIVVPKICESVSAKDLPKDIVEIVNKLLGEHETNRQPTALPMPPRSKPFNPRLKTRGKGETNNEPFFAPRA